MKKITAYLLAISLSLVFALPAVSLAQSTNSDVQAQITALLVQIKKLQAQIAQLQAGQANSSCHDFNTNFGIGSKSDEVSILLGYLVKEGVAMERSSNFSSTFDEYLASSVSAFQEKYRNEILTPAGLSSGTGYLGPRTRARLNQIYGCDRLASLPYISGTPAISGLFPSSGPAGTQVIITSNYKNSADLSSLSGLPAGESYGVWISNGSYSAQLLDSSYISNGKFQVTNNNSITVTIPGSGCPGAESPSCSSNFSTTLPVGTYSIYIRNANGVSNKVNFTLTTGGVTQSTITVSSRDIETGMAVYGSYTMNNKTYTANELSAYFKTAPAGKYDFTVSASGYQSMPSSVTLPVSSDPRFRFMLSPLAKPVELSDSYLQQFITPAAGLLVGYVVDGDGQPISGVTVGTPIKKATTNDRGFYALNVNIPPTVSCDGIDLTFSKTGYRTERYTHALSGSVIDGPDMGDSNSKLWNAKVNATLQIGTGVNITDDKHKLCQ